jgi:hypothetical protein
VTAPGTTVRSVTVDRRRHRRIVLDLVLDAARHRPAGWWVGATVVALVALGAGRRLWYTGLVSTAWAADGELVVADVTGQYRLPRGSVLVVRRSGRNANVYGRSLSFVLPGELLSDDDVAFLEGHAAGPVPAPAPPSGLARSLVVTEDVQAHLVADATRVVLLTADTLFPGGGVVVLALLWAATSWAGFLWLAGVLLVLAVPAAVRFVHRRQAFAAARTTLLPLGLFRPEDVHQLAASVRGRR